jgi:hypothetical protein
MADEQPSLHIDTDWKKQAQEEKRRLAEQEQQKKAAAAAAPPPKAGPAEPAGMPRAGAGRGAGERGLPPATFTTLVQSIVTQVLFYLGELSARGAEPSVNLDMAKHNIDMLGVIEEKTRGNLTEDEKRLLDGALYETRMRYVSIAQQVAMV